VQAAPIIIIIIIIIMIIAHSTDVVRTQDMRVWHKRFVLALAF
jgi:hypothetical protein